MLPADGNSGPGYMFYATPEQKANVEMYAKYVTNGTEMNVPIDQMIANSVSRDKAHKDLYENLTLGAAAGALGIAVGGPIAALPGAPIFSTGGALGSAAWASPVGTGAISAGINAGSQYYKDGKINPVDLGGAFGTGVAVSYGGLLWNIGVNMMGGATTTALNKVLNGNNDSIIGAGITSGVLSMVGYSTGRLAESWINSALRPSINNASGWAISGSWSGSGWNLVRPNVLGAIGGSIGGSVTQEAVTPALTYPSNEGEEVVSRWIFAFLGVWGICLAGMYIAWLLGLILNCFFVSGCFSRLTVGGVFSAIHVESVLVRATLLSIAFIAIAWISRRGK
ncbi:hypothetical protein [Burkholderia territorii]|uniref:hypothetical protein n=2 Tax=Burkholderia cepacia complex TaxID=87882 RepID=UPI000A91D3F7|nr:hypothetical protein [Burkholderia territorii]